MSPWLQSLGDLIANFVQDNSREVVFFIIGGFSLPIVWIVWRWWLRRGLIAENRAFRQQNEELRETRARLQAEATSLQDKLRDLHPEVARLRDQCEELAADKHALELSLAKALAEAEKADELAAQLEAAEQRVAALESAIDELRGCVASLTRELETEREASIDLSDDLDESRTQLVEFNQRFQALWDFDGKVWECSTGYATHPFVPTAKRRARILSFVNLKGGVGKTTLCANLAATLARRGYRVLAIDLDFQGSLSSLCLDGRTLAEIREHQGFVDSIFDRAQVSTEEFHRLQHSVPNVDGLSCIAADEPLFYVETSAMARFIAKTDKRDVRFLFREHVHTPDIADAYDFVLVDCPPRLSTACINALAASDAVIVPVILDTTSAEATPRLLRSLANMRHTLCPHLQLQGVVANNVKFHGGQLRKDQANVWSTLPAKCRDAWGQPVYQFRAMIKSDVAFATAAAKSEFAIDQSRAIESAFADLAREIVQRTDKRERCSSDEVTIES